MSIDAILRSAISGLNTSQATLRTTANNIANVNTPGYARKVTHQETLVLNGETAGVKLARIERVVDEFLQRELRGSTAEMSRYEAMNQIHRQVQSLLGDPSANTSLTGRLDRVFGAFSDLSLEPDSSLRRINTVNELTTFTDEVSRLASKLQDLRVEAERQIAQDISKVNAALIRVDQLNSEIQRETLLGNEGTGLEDQRTQALADIAEVIDIRTNDATSGAISIVTTDGVVLLDESGRRLIHTQQGTVTSATRFAQITANVVDPNTGTVASSGTPLDPRVQAGSLRGWLDMRDSVLPDLALALGEFAGQVMDQFNAVHNDNAAVPPLSTLTGRNTGLAGTDAIGFTGQVTFALLDSNQAVTTTVAVDFDAATYTVNGGSAVALSGTTLADLISDVNTGFSGGATLALSSGVLSLTAASSSNGVVIQQGSTASSRGGRGFSHFFGMNDLLTANAQSHYDTGLTTSSAHGFGSGATTVAFEVRGPDNDVVKTFTLDFSAVGGSAMSDVLSTLNTGLSGFVTFALDSNGALTTTMDSAYENYKLNVTSDSTNRASTGVSFSQFFGIGDRYRADAAIDLAVRSDIKSSPAKLALADLDLSVASGEPALTVADGRGALAFEALVSSTVSFAQAGQLAAISTTLGNYAASILANAGQSAAEAERNFEDRSALVNELEVRRDEYSGVNLDEEMSNMVIYQNAYNASARMVATAREMYDVLLSILN